MIARLLMLVAFLGVTLPAVSQTGHPAKGSWAGFLHPIAGTESTEDERVRLLIDDHNGELSGTLNPGRRGVDMSSVELEAETWTLTIQADTPEGDLEMVGKLENLGSWTNRRYSGFYTRGDEQGTFTITLN